MGPCPHGSQRDLQGISRRQLAVPDHLHLHARQDLARCARSRHRANRSFIMNKSFIAALMALAVAAASPATAQSEISAISTLSALPIASVAVTGSAAAGASVA